MNRKKNLLLVLCLALMPFASAQAQTMYQCIQPDGKKVLSDSPEQFYKADCKPIELPPASYQSSSPPDPNTFRYDRKEEEAKAKGQPSDLERELINERVQLEKAKEELANQEAIRHGNERNYQKVLDRLQPYKDKVSLHERNIEEINKKIEASGK